ncbi:MAG: helix-turn-helix domain-containing protein [Acidimicrobiales bacterium]
MSASNTRKPTAGRAHVAAHRALASESRQALLHALAQSKRPLDASEAGRAVHLHRNTARVHLRKLASVGLVRAVFEYRTTPGRPRVLYQLVPSNDDRDIELSRDVNYRELARVLADQLATDAQAQQKAEAAGRSWAAAMAADEMPHRRLSSREAIDTIAKVLHAQGFDPEPRAEGDASGIYLRRCPFADVAQELRSVICAVHLGMISAAFDELDSPVSVAGLDSFVSTDPLLCVVHLEDRRRRRTTNIRYGVRRRA